MQNLTFIKMLFNSFVFTLFTVFDWFRIAVYQCGYEASVYSSIDYFLSAFLPNSSEQKDLPRDEGTVDFLATPGSFPAFRSASGTFWWSYGSTYECRMSTIKVLGRWLLNLPLISFLNVAPFSNDPLLFFTGFVKLPNSERRLGENVSQLIERVAWFRYSKRTRVEAGVDRIRRIEVRCVRKGTRVYFYDYSVRNKSLI